jgi:hypothetical protein
MDSHFGGVIWTNHALDRLRERGISQGDAWATWRRPDDSHYEKDKGVWVFRRSWNRQMVEVVAKKNEKGEWIIFSVWSRRVFGKQKSQDSFLRLILRKVFKF